MLRSPGQFTSLDEIGNLVVLTRDGVPVYMRDIAVIRDGSEDVRSLIRVNGKPGVRLSINKQSGENTVDVSAALKREVDAHQPGGARRPAVGDERHRGVHRPLDRTRSAKR